MKKLTIKKETVKRMAVQTKVKAGAHNFTNDPLSVCITCAFHQFGI